MTIDITSVLLCFVTSGFLLGGVWFVVAWCGAFSRPSFIAGLLLFMLWPGWFYMACRIALDGSPDGVAEDHKLATKVLLYILNTSESSTEII